MTTMLTHEVLSIQSAYDMLDDPACGAAVVFVGRVRNHHEGRAVSQIHYTAYADMVQSEGDAIIVEARAMFDIRKAVVLHHAGTLPVGGNSVVVGVASAHRADSFAACSWIMDEVKKRLPVWKEEFYQEGDRGWPSNMP